MNARRIAFRRHGRFPVALPGIEGRNATGAVKPGTVRRCVIGAFSAIGVLALPATAAALQTVTLLPSRDTPIYADDGVTTFPFATHSNGAGETLYVGTNGTGSARRSLIQFDLGVLPQGSVVTAAKLTLFCDREPDSEYETLSLHTVTEGWTTGGSNSDALGTPGQGAPAQPGDSTWYYRSWPGPENPEGLKWSQPGALFDPAVIASQRVGPLSVGGDQSSVYVWSSDAMVADVNAWLQEPSTNFGWIMTGNETQTRSVKRFISSEGRVNNWLKPNLILNVEIPDGAPATLSLVSSANPADFAQSFSITATLLGGHAPGGTVTFYEGTTPLAGCSAIPLAGGKAVCRVAKLPAGAHSMAATYSGDSANPAVAAEILQQSVDEPKSVDDSTTWIVLTSSAPASSPGETVAFTANVRGGLGPAGTVTFLDGSQVLCDGVTVSRRTAVCTKSSLSRGKHRIGAIYSGDGHNLASSSPRIDQIVAPGRGCSAASLPTLDAVQRQWLVHADQTLKFSVTASDCLKRPVTLRTTKLPPGASFVQGEEATTGKQKGVLTWTPGVDAVERTKILSFKASVAAGKGLRTSRPQKTRIEVLPPLLSGIPDSVAAASVGRLLIAKAVWHPNTRHFTVSGRIRWKTGTSRLVRANAIAQSIELLDPLGNTVFATVQPSLSGRWQVHVALPDGIAPPGRVEARFRGIASLPREVRLLK